MLRCIRFLLGATLCNSKMAAALLQRSLMVHFPASARTPPARFSLASSVRLFRRSARRRPAAVLRCATRPILAACRTRPVQAPPSPRRDVSSSIPQATKPRARLCSCRSTNPISAPHCRSHTASHFISYPHFISRSIFRPAAFWQDRSEARTIVGTRAGSRRRVTQRAMCAPLRLEC